MAASGFRLVTRGTAMRRVRGVGVGGEPVAPNEPEFPRTVAVLTGCPLAGGTHAELALNGEATVMVLDPAFGAALEAVFRDDLGRAAAIDLAEFRRRGSRASA